MSMETSANPSGIQDEVTVPELRTFQTLDSSIGRVTDNINLFRGNVTFPLTLLSLSNRGGLEVDVVLNYQSDVERDVTTWNLESPTGCIGLGWEMPYEMIELVIQGSVSPYDDSYYLAATDGSRSRIFVTGKTAEVWTFEAESFSFSSIRYFPEKQTWHVTDSEGTTRIFGADVSAGDSPFALRNAIKWGGPDGNWTDSSVRTGQSYFPISWNLSRVRNRWGEEIVFGYSSFPDDEVRIGGTGGLQYTRASYLRSITDPSGRIVEFGYGQKLFSSTIREYQPPHINPNPAGPHAYQDRYETRFLDNLKVSQLISGVAQQLFTIRFDYTVENLVGSAVPGNPAELYKRYLRGITTVNADGAILPGLRFDYYRQGDLSNNGAPLHLGALKSVTYPQGGTATYTYDRRPVRGTAQDLTLSSSDPDWVSGVPRFWFGPDYVVITHYDQLSSNLLTVQLYDWNGRWLSSTPVVTELPFDLDLDSVQVLLEEDFIALSYKLAGAGTNGELQTWAIRRAYGQYGKWNSVRLEMPPLTSSEATYQVTAGAGFIAAATGGSSDIYRYTWNPRSKRWQQQNIYLPTGSAGEWSMAGYGNFLVLCQYQPGMQLSLTMYYYDVATLQWNDNLPPLDGIGTYVWNPDLPKLSWSLSPSFATATYIVALNEAQKTFDYEARIYQWDKNFQQLSSPPPITGTGLPIATQEPVFLSVATGSLVGNVGNLRRFDGVDWTVGDLGTFNEGADVAQFTYGDDLAVGVSSDKGVIGAYDPWTGEFNTLEIATGSTDVVGPTINYPYITARNRIYRQLADGSVTSLNQELPLDIVAVSNQAPAFIAFGLADGTSYVWQMQNGVLAPNPTQVPGVLFPPGPARPGKLLSGPFAFATYSGPSLDQADEITLNRVLFNKFAGPAATFVVASVTVADGFGNNAAASFDYDTPGATGTVSPFGLSTQFAQVKSVTGSADPTIAPFGYSIHQFFDGMNPASAPPQFLYSLAGGLLREVDGFDSAGTQVGRTLRSWEIATSILDPLTGTAIPLIGSYIRMSGSTETVYDVNPMSTTPQPPLEVPTVFTYNEANGKPRLKQTQYYDNGMHAFVTQIESYLFAYEKYPAVAAPDLNLLTAKVQTTQTVGGAITKIEATTWAPVGPGAVWAPYRSFQARGAGSVLTAANWDNTQPPDPTQWKSFWQITQRDLFGGVLEYVAADGLTNSIITDSSGQLVLAAFGNASTAAQQVVYCGFEVYENLQGWTLAGGSPLAAIVPGDSITGLRALVMAGSQFPNSTPLARSLELTEPLGRQYVLSCWIKTPAGFAPGAGSANWTVSGLADGAVTLDIPDTRGNWEYLYLLFDIPAKTAPQSITLTLMNTTAQAVKVDNIRVSPTLSGFTGTVFNPLLHVANATIQSTGALRRQLRGEFGETQADVNCLETVTELRSSYLSRRGNLGAFSALDPNSMLTVRPRGWSFYQSFNLGGVFGGSWTSPTPTHWTTRAGSLMHLAGTSDTITFDGFPAANQEAINVFGASVRAKPQSALNAVVGFSCGALELAWTPSTATWTLTDTAADVLLATATVRSLFDVDYAAYSGQLDSNTLPADFLVIFPLAGLPLSSGSTVAASVPTKAWRLTDAVGATVYYLVRAADLSKIQVAAFPREWTALVVGQTLTFFADGGRVFSKTVTTAPTRAVSLFATEAISFDNAVFFTDTAIGIDYIDGDGRATQGQVGEPGAIVAAATLYDGLGRDVIKTQGAKLCPPAGQWGAFLTNLAVFDWTTLRMGGLVDTQNPSSGGFPYWRTRYEASPLGRKAELGLPGAAYAITTQAGGPHTTRFLYGLNSAVGGFDAGKFACNTTINADGVSQIELVDQRGYSVAALAPKALPPAEQAWDVTQRGYDFAGNLITSVTPMGWSDNFSYDFLGNATLAARTNEGTTRSMYDSIGRLRFQMDARGAAASPSYIRYWKYDALSRVTEEGCSLQSWPGVLAQHVDDQSFPVATASNLYAYDFQVPAESSPGLLALGNLTRIISMNEVAIPSVIGTPGADGFRATEALWYDIYGSVVRHRLTRANDTGIYDTVYNYNNQGELTGVHYPGSGGAFVQYRMDLPGKITAVLINNQVCAAYTYDQNGNAITEDVYADSGVRIGSTRTLSYEPPGWLANSAGTGFSEQTVYAPTDESHGYYSGAPTRSITGARGPNSPITSSYQYDSQGRLASILIGKGAADLFIYDANGNLKTLGPVRNTYSLDTQDRVQATVSGTDTQTFGYDAAGEINSRASASQPGENLTLTWDCFRGTALDAQIGSVTTGQTSQSVRYGYKGRRVLKSVTGTDGLVSSTLYLRGAGDDILAELPSTGPARQYIFGPLGLVQMRVAATPYFVARDRLGSARALLDTAATLVAGFDYLPFGSLNGAAFGSNPALMRYRFTGRELDESGLYDFRLRLYDSLQGRFISADPAHQFLSPYLYAANNPLLFTDPDGAFAIALLIPFLAAIAEVIIQTALVGAAVGAAVGIVQSIETIVSNDLSGAEAAGAFFGTVILSTVGGALSGGVGAATGALIGGATLISAAAISVGIALEGGIAAAQAAGEAALVGEDPGEAAWQNAIAAGTTFVAGALTTAGFSRILPPTLSARTTAIVSGSASGLVGGITGGAVTAAVSDSGSSVAASDILLGGAFGLLGGLTPEFVGKRPSAQVGTERQRLLQKPVRNYGTMS